jgi:hypothetical protein
MNTLIAFPDWVPWWVPMVLLVPALLYALAFLFMPFSVLGVKTRLEVIEGRLDEIQQEIRHLALRLPVGPREVDFEDVYAPIQQASRRERAISDRPPIPPAPHDLYTDDALVERPAPPPHMRPVRRAEPVIVRPELTRQEAARPETARQETVRQETARQDRAEPRLDRRR